MASLYKLNEMYRKIEDVSSDPEVLKDTLDSIDFENIVNNKLDDCIGFINHLKANNDEIDAEINRLNDLKHRNNKTIDGITERIKYTMINLDKRKIKTDFHSASFRKSKKVEITDESKLPQEYFTIPAPKVNKTEIKKAITSGVVLRGAKIVENENLSLK